MADISLLTSLASKIFGDNYDIKGFTQLIDNRTTEQAIKDINSFGKYSGEIDKFGSINKPVPYKAGSKCMLNMGPDYDFLKCVSEENGGRSVGALDPKTGKYLETYSSIPTPPPEPFFNGNYFKDNSKNIIFMLLGVILFISGIYLIGQGKS